MFDFHVNYFSNSLLNCNNIGVAGTISSRSVSANDKIVGVNKVRLSMVTHLSGAFLCAL